MTYEDIVAIAEYLKSKTAIKPDIGVICGSGLGGLGDNLDEDHPPLVIPYDDIPKFPKTTGEEDQIEILRGRRMKRGEWNVCYCINAPELQSIATIFH